MIPVIICGGFGTKLWPLSRQTVPKQFLPLLNGKSLFQSNYDALRLKFSPREIYVSTNPDQAKMAQQQVPDIPTENYILEPEMRNQGPATGLIAAMLFKKGLPDEPFMLIQVDDLREPADKFIEMIDICDRLAKSSPKYITGGIKPDRRVQGVDYLMKGRLITGESEVPVYEVAKFVWRSSIAEIDAGIAQGTLLIHTNHTCMTPRNLLAMMEKYRPDWHGPLLNIVNGGDVQAEYAKMSPGPVEEVTQKVHEDSQSLVVELPFSWTDIGTFDSLHKYYLRQGTYRHSDPTIEIESQNNLVISRNSDRVIALVGVEGLAVVDTPDALIVTSKEKSGSVNEVVKELKNRRLKVY